MEHPADWLGDADQVAELGHRLAGIPVPADRLALYRRTLHPEVLCRATAWSPGRPVEIFDRAHGLDLSTGFCGGPLERVISGGASAALTGPEIDRPACRWTDPLRGLGLEAVLLFPLPKNAALAIGTRRTGGFSGADRAAIERLVHPLAKSGNRPKRFSQ